MYLVSPIYNSRNFNVLLGTYARNIYSKIYNSRNFNVLLGDTEGEHMVISTTVEISMFS